ncbi:SA1788 family PVL leukocidin-associated protein, partial [Staphylococcus sp.]
ERMEQRRLQELKRKKPHLFTVPQKHSRSEWCKYLMENDIFPRKVVRS